MASSASFSTTLSTKGQMVLPKAVRERKKWKAGTRLVVEERPEGLLVSEAALEFPVDISRVAGCLKYDGPPVTIEDMNLAGPEGAVERYRRSMD